MSEQTIQKKILDYIKEIGAYAVKTITTNRTGVPDILVCWRGEFIAIECKDVGKLNRLTPLQMHHLSMIERAGGKVLVADSVASVREFFQAQALKEPV